MNPLFLYKSLKKEKFGGSVNGIEVLYSYKERFEGEEKEVVELLIKYAEELLK